MFNRTLLSTGSALSIVKTLMGKVNGTVVAEQIDNKLYITCKWDLE